MSGVLQIDYALNTDQRFAANALWAFDPGLFRDRHGRGLVGAPTTRDSFMSVRCPSWPFEKDVNRFARFITLDNTLDFAGLNGPHEALKGG